MQRATTALAWAGAPLYWLQGRRVRRQTPGLAEAPGERAGCIEGAGPAHRLVGLGESPMAAVGLEHQAEGVISRLAGRLAAAGRRVEWQTAAASGATARYTRDELLLRIEPRRADTAIVGLGVNDCLGLRAPRRWRDDLCGLLAAIRRRVEPRRIVLTGVPPMQHFPALPSPLSDWLGLRAAGLDAVARDLAEAEPDLVHAPMRFVENPAGLFCRDGFHPNAAAHALWADQLIDFVKTN